MSSTPSAHINVVEVILTYPSQTTFRQNKLQDISLALQYISVPRDSISSISSIVVLVYARVLGFHT
jgi:hypothetical protein